MLSLVVWGPGVIRASDSGQDCKSLFKQVVEGCGLWPGCFAFERSSPGSSHYLFELSNSGRGRLPSSARPQDAKASEYRILYG